MKISRYFENGESVDFEGSVEEFEAVRGIFMPSIIIRLDEKLDKTVFESMCNLNEYSARQV